MARTDAVAFMLELAAEWRRLGAEVTFEPGWERRGNGQSAAYEGGIVHHTAFLSSFANPFPARNTLLNGRPGLSGPLCNVAGPVCPADRPRLHVVAAFPANHAGASGGRSMGPLPTTSMFNRVVVGLETDYAGLTPMIGGQRQAALIFTRGLATVLGRSTEYIRAHGETSITGKWDIGYANGKTYDMAAFRRDAAALSPGPKPVPSPPEFPMSVRIAVTPDNTCWFVTDLRVESTSSLYSVGAVAKMWGVPVISVTREELQDNINLAARNLAALTAAFAQAIPSPTGDVADVDEDAIAARLLPGLLAKMDSATPLSAEDIQAMLDDSEIDTVNLLADRLKA